MVNKKLEKLRKDPYKLPTRIATREEIISHSSMITNLRLDLLFRSINICKQQAWESPVVQSINKYFSILYTLYDDIYPLLEPKYNKKIMKYFKDYFTDYKELISGGKGVADDCFSLLTKLDMINRLIKGDLQSKSYFFKIGERGIKNIGESIEIIEREGGFFGKG